MFLDLETNRALNYMYSMSRKSIITMNVIVELIGMELWHLHWQMEPFWTGLERFHYVVSFQVELFQLEQFHECLHWQMSWSRLVQSDSECAV